MYLFLWFLEHDLSSVLYGSDDSNPKDCYILINFGSNIETRIFSPSIIIAQI